jgi:hypothetical protein
MADAPQTALVRSDMPVSDMRELAQAIAKSNLFGMNSPDQALALMAIAQAEGRHPAEAARDYHIIQGRASLKAETILARFQVSGGSVRWIESTATKCEAEFSHPRGGSLTIKWDMARAALAGLGGKDNWKKYPAQMLRARCISEGVRAVYPAVLAGFLSSEEAQDIDKAPASAHAARCVRETTAEVVESAPAAPVADPVSAPSPSPAPTKPETPTKLEPIIEEVTYVKSTQKQAKNGNNYWVADFIDAAGKPLRMTTWDTNCGEIINALAADDAVKIAYVLDGQYKTLHKIKRLEAAEQQSIPLPDAPPPDDTLPF